VVTLLLLTAAPFPAGASPTAGRDPAIGPHAQEEQQHTGPLQLEPARTAVLPRSTAVPAPQALTREVFGFATYWMLSSYPNWDFSLLSTIAYFGLDVNSDGNFNRSTPGWTGWNSQALVDIINRAHLAGGQVVLTIKAFDNATINAIVTSPAATQTAITATIDAIAAKQLDGVNVDFEGSSSPQYPDIQRGFTNFMTALSTQVHDRWPDAFVTVDTYSGAASWDGGIFNIAALDPVVDAFFLMDYDMGLSNDPTRALPNAPMNGWTWNVTTSVAQYLTKTSPWKVILGVPYYGYKWSTTTSQQYSPVRSAATARTYAGVLEDFACANPSRAWDSTGQSPWAWWWSPASGDPCGGNYNSWRQLHYDDATSLGVKYDLVNANDLAGTGMWALGYDGSSRDLWDVLAAKFTLSSAQFGPPLSRKPSLSRP
jgi:GH18 family chitinase